MMIEPGMATSIGKYLRWGEMIGCRTSGWLFGYIETRRDCLIWKYFCESTINTLTSGVSGFQRLSSSSHNAQINLK